MAALPCEEDQDAYSISVTPDRGNTDSQCPSQFAFLSFLEVPYTSESESSFDNDWNSMNCVSFQMENADRCSSCSIDIDVEEESLGMPKTEEKTVHCAANTESSLILQSASQRKISVQIGGKIMQLLLNHNPVLLESTSRDNSMTEGAHDTPRSRWRRYKRAASIDSRKVVIFFSVLSSMGTLLLIYLTLRVKQIGDGLVHA
ncbi:hypothetical protein NE237_017042 [Protea cynaroides]|uniref:Uncharacterized protein n=1 Tax=Protea cynaroides TaxID=273540 RepID=A0A9Q0K7A1_9MAGN|nr:hypothetical protein NE237_017042 [Protea cynaroides]